MLLFFIEPLNQIACLFIEIHFANLFKDRSIKSTMAAFGA
jgi:hypothetical protein